MEDTFPSGLWDRSNFPRGPERLTAWVAAAAGAIAPTTAGAFQVAHALNALLWALAALPVYGAARLLGTGRVWSLLPATLAVLTPFALYATSLLNTAAGYLASACLLYAMVRTLVRPSWRADALVLAALTFVALARLGNAPVVIALAPALLAQALWDPRPLGEALRARARQHAVLVAVAALVLVVVVLRGPDGFLGGERYGGGRLSQDVTLDGAWVDLRAIAARMAWTTGIVPLAVGLAWLVRQAIRPVKPDDGAFAVLALATALAFGYAYYLSFDEDRYAVVLLPFVAIAFGRALAAGGTGWGVWAGAGAVALLAGRAIATADPLPPGLDARDTFFAPGRRFFEEVVRGNLIVHTPIDGRAILLITLVAVGASVAVVLPRARRPAVVVAVVVAGSVGYGAAAMAWSIERWTSQATGGDTTSFAQQAFVDAAVPEPERAVTLANNPTQDPGFVDVLNQLRVWNRRIAPGFVQIEAPVLEPCCVQGVVVKLRGDPATGAIDEIGGAVPRHLIVHRGFQEATLATVRPPAVSPAFGSVAVVEPSRPPRLSTLVRGARPDGWRPAGRAVRVRVFGGGTGCLTGVVEAPSAAPPGAPPAGPSVTWRIGSARGRLGPGAAQTFTVALRRPVAVQDVTVRSDTGRLPDGTRVGVRLNDLLVGPC